MLGKDKENKKMKIAILGPLSAHELWKRLNPEVDVRSFTADTFGDMKEFAPDVILVHQRRVVERFNAAGYYALPYDGNEVTDEIVSAVSTALLRK